MSVWLHAEELDVNVAAEARIEEHVSPGMAVVIVHINAVAVPVPIAAPRNCSPSNQPILGS